MEFMACAPDRGFTLRPNCGWDVSEEFKHNILGRSDTDYAKGPDSRKSVTGMRVSLNGAVTQWRSMSQKHVSLKV